MKIYPDCAACMLKRTYETTKLASRSRETRERVMSEILRLTANNFKPSMCPSVLGTLQSNLICALTKNVDPFREKKLHVIRKALARRKKFERYVNDGKDARLRFRRAVLVAVCGNTIEISAPQHDVDVRELEREMFACIRKGLVIDDVGKIYEKLKRARDVLYICDNAGEAVFDTILIKEIKKYARVVVAVASGPVDDDITIKEARLAGLNKIAPVLAKGCCFGVWREACTRAFWKKLKGADLIFAKGM
ncbi:MAG: ARMT1-like domain-containing protein, partial [Candidatus Micrarchaeota archaeon]